MLAHEEPFSRRHAVLLGLAAVSPASSVFAILVPVLVVLGPATIASFGLAVGLGSLVAFTYVTAAESVTSAPGEPHWVARVLGPACGSGVAALTVTSLALVCAILLQALSELLGGTGWPHAALAGSGVVAAALLGVRRTLWLIVVGLVVETASLVVIVGEALRSGELHAAGHELLHAPAGLGLAPLAAVPTFLFALNGYGQAAYLVGDAPDRARRVRRVVFATFLLAVLLQGVPVLVLSLSLPPGLDRENDFPLLTLLAGMHVGSSAIAQVHLGIGFALANALLAILHFGGRLMTPLEPTPGAVDDSASMRRRTLALGAAMVLLSALPSSALTLGVGQNLVLLYLMVAAAAFQAFRTIRRRAVAAAQVTLMFLLLLRGAATEGRQIAVTASVFIAGLVVGLVRNRGPAPRDIRKG